MKRFLTPAATFNPTVGTLDLSTIPSFDIRRLAAVFDLKTQAMIYGPVAGFGSTAVANGVVTLQASLTGLAGSDQLLVIYDDATGKVAEDASVQAVLAAINTLITDVANNHTDLGQLHTDLNGTLHADLQAIATKLGSSPAQSSDVAAVVTALGTPPQKADVQAVVTKLGTPAQAADVQAVTAKLGTSPAQSADVAAVATKLGTPAQSSDVQAIVGKLGASPAQSTDIAAIGTKLGTPAQTADIAAVTSRLGAAPAQTGDVSALGVLLQSILTTLQAVRTESLWTDDSSAFYVRVETPGVTAPTWLTYTGAASAAPGAGARPADGTTLVVTSDVYRALNTAAGGSPAYNQGDLIKHVETQNPKSGSIVGQFWLNTTQNTSLTAAQIASTDLQLLDPQSEGAATLAGQQAALAQLTTIATGIATLHTDSQTQHADLVTLHTDSGTTLHADLVALLQSLGGVGDAATAQTAIGLLKGILARHPALGTAIMAGATPVTLATDDKVALVLGGPADVAATADAGTFSLPAMIKRGLANWTTLLTRIPVLGAALANVSMPMALATDQLATLAKDGTDATAAVMPAGGAGIRGWLSGIYTQALAMVTSLGTLATNSNTSQTADTSTYQPAIQAATTREGSLSASGGYPEGLDSGASGKLGVQQRIWANLVALLAAIKVTQPRSISSNAPRVSVTGTLTAVGDAVVVACDGMNTAVAQLAAATAGAAIFEASADGQATWTSVNMVPYGGGAATGTPSFAAASQLFEMACGGLTHVRIRCTTAFNAATAVVMAAANGHKSLRVGAPSANPVPVLPAAFGIGNSLVLGTSAGTDTIVVAKATANGVAIPVPVGARSMLIELTAGAYLQYAMKVAANPQAPVALGAPPAAQVKRSNAYPAGVVLDFEMPLGGGRVMYVTDWVAGSDGTPPTITFL